MKINCSVFRDEHEYLGGITGIELPIIDKNKEATLVEVQDKGRSIAIHTDWNFEGTYDGMRIEDDSEVEINIAIPLGRMKLFSRIPIPLSTMRMGLCKGQASLIITGSTLYGEKEENMKLSGLAHVKGIGPLVAPDTDVLRILSEGF